MKKVTLIIPASKFLKPSKKELLERIEYLEKLLNVPYESKFNEPKAGDLCAFADHESDFDDFDFKVRILKSIDCDGYFLDATSRAWNYARKVELKFL